MVVLGLKGSKYKILWDWFKKWNIVTHYSHSISVNMLWKLKQNSSQVKCARVTFITYLAVLSVSSALLSLTTKFYSFNNINGLSPNSLLILPL